MGWQDVLSGGVISTLRQWTESVIVDASPSLGLMPSRTREELGGPCHGHPRTIEHRCCCPPHPQHV
jgi:hypothetical protein